MLDSDKEAFCEPLKKDEEIMALTIDESLPVYERVRIMITGNELQKCSVFGNINSIFKEAEDEARLLQMIIPQLQEELEDSGGKLEHHREIFDNILQVVACDAISSSAKASFVLPLLFQYFLQTRECYQIDYAFKACKELCLRISHDDIMNKIVPFINYPISAGTFNRQYISIRIFGIICRQRLIRSSEVVSTWLNGFLELCQDISMDIRVACADAMSSIMRNMTPEAIDKHLLQDLIDLANDEEHKVNSAALKSILRVSDVFSLTQLQNSIFPILLRSIETARSRPELYQIFANYIGQLMNNLSKLGIGKLDPNKLKVFVDLYADMCKMEDESIKKFCAFNFPAVLKCWGIEKFGDDLLPLYMILGRDYCPEVRSIISRELTVVITMLSNDDTVPLRDLVVSLLEDPIGEIETSVFHQLPVIVPQLYEKYVESIRRYEGQKHPVIPAAQLWVPFVAFGSKLGHDWRGQIEFMQTASQLCAEYFPPERIGTEFLPLLFSFIQTGCVPVRELAADVLVDMLTYVPKAPERTEILDRLKELGPTHRSNSYWQRLLYAKIAKRVRSRFSRRFFRDFFLGSILPGVDDSVLPVRLAFIDLIVDCVRCLDVPLHNELLKRINEILNRLMNPNADPVSPSPIEVIEAAKAALAAIEAKGPRDVSVKGLSVTSEEDQVDKQREEHEDRGEKIESIQDDLRRRIGMVTMIKRTHNPTVKSKATKGAPSASTNPRDSSSMFARGNTSEPKTSTMSRSPDPSRAAATKPVAKSSIASKTPTKVQAKTTLPKIGERVRPVSSVTFGTSHKNHSTDQLTLDV